MTDRRRFLRLNRFLIEQLLSDDDERPHVFQQHGGLQEKLRPPLTTVLLLFSPELADISGILTKTWTPHCRTNRAT